MPLGWPPGGGREGVAPARPPPHASAPPAPPAAGPAGRGPRAGGAPPRPPAPPPAPPARPRRSPPAPRPPPPPAPAFVLAWSFWPRAHQTVAQAYHWGRPPTLMQPQL